MTTKVLVTGATGALGGPTLRALRNIVADAEFLILARSDAAASLPDARVLHADFSRVGLGSPDLIDELSGVDLAIHMAADVRWNQSLKRAMLINGVGTWQLIRLLERAAPHLRRFVHVSTVWVDSLPTCTDCPPYLSLAGGEDFRNAYEVSKWCAERYVRRSSLPWSIVRPSLIVGSSQDGAIDRFNGLYLLFHLFLRGRLPFFVGAAKGLVDIVPVDIVVKAIESALLEPGLEGKTVYAYSGPGAPTVEELAQACAIELNELRGSAGCPPIDRPAIVNCETYRRLYYPLMAPELRPGQKRFVEMMDVFHPYMSLRRPIQALGEAEAFLAPEFARYIPRVIGAWAKGHPALLAGTPHRWTATT